jgi:hypothetical protein
MECQRHGLVRDGGEVAEAAAGVGSHGARGREETQAVDRIDVEEKEAIGEAAD